MGVKQLVGWVLALGAINWGLVGAANMNLVESLLGAGSMMTQIVYIIIGVAGVYKVYMMVAGGKK